METDSHTHAHAHAWTYIQMYYVNEHTLEIVSTARGFFQIVKRFETKFNWRGNKIGSMRIREGMWTGTVFDSSHGLLLQPERTTA